MTEQEFGLAGRVEIQPVRRKTLPVRYNSNQDRYNFKLPFTNITNFIFMKLDHSNYLLWKDQFESVLISVDLFEYIDGSIQEPASLFLLMVFKFRIQRGCIGESRGSFCVKLFEGDVYSINFR